MEGKVAIDFSRPPRGRRRDRGPLPAVRDRRLATSPAAVAKKGHGHKHSPRPAKIGYNDNFNQFDLHTPKPLNPLTGLPLPFPIGTGGTKPGQPTRVPSGGDADAAGAGGRRRRDPVCRSVGPGRAAAGGLRLVGRGWHLQPRPEGRACARSSSFSPPPAGRMSPSSATPPTAPSAPTATTSPTSRASLGPPLSAIRRRPRSRSGTSRTSSATGGLHRRPCPT